MTTFVTPKTWVAGEVVDETDLNTHVRDNMNAVNEKAGHATGTASATNNIQTSSGSLVDMTNMSVTITPAKDGMALLLFHGVLGVASPNEVSVQFADGGNNPLGPVIKHQVATGGNEFMASVHALAPVTGGTEYTFKVKWMTSGGTADAWNRYMSVVCLPS